MNITSLLKNKKDSKKNILESYNLKDEKLPLGLLVLKDFNINKDFLDAFKILPSNFIIVNDENIREKNIVNSKDIIDSDGFDFIVYNSGDYNLMKFFNKGVVPIILKDHHITNLLSEFNAKRSQGNSFIFDNNNLCDIYYAVIRYLENYKFPFDNKTLVKNILAI